MAAKQANDAIYSLESKPGRPKVFENKPDPIPSPAMLDSHLRLAAAIIAAAVRDLRGLDQVRALDALLWLASDGLLYLQALGFDQVNSFDLLEAIANGRIYATPRGRPFSGSSAMRAAGNDSA